MNWHRVVIAVIGLLGFGVFFASVAIAGYLGTRWGLRFHARCRRSIGLPVTPSEPRVQERVTLWRCSEHGIVDAGVSSLGGKTCVHCMKPCEPDQYVPDSLYQAEKARAEQLEAQLRSEVSISDGLHDQWEAAETRAEEAERRGEELTEALSEVLAVTQRDRLLDAIKKLDTATVFRSPAAKKLYSVARQIEEGR